MNKDAFVIGVDYGTDSVRSMIVNAYTGAELASATAIYPRWGDMLYCNAASNQFRQHPKDYIEGLEYTIKSCIAQAGQAVIPHIKGISIDTTGSTPVAVDAKGTPLALLPEFEDNPNAMFVLWKDHCSIKEAAEINEHAKKFKTNYLQFVGGVYSSEWFWAKLLFILRKDPSVRKACVSWVEHCDWIPFLLTGGSQVSSMKRGVCSAGHKALWADAFGGLPPEDFFSSLDPLLSGFRANLFTQTHTADQPAGYLSAEWAERLGLSDSVIVGIGAFDAHMGAVGGQIESYHLSKVMGTSTCDMLVAPLEEVKDKLIAGICGQVPGSIVPGMMGMEAGQSAFGDAYAWFRRILEWPLQEILIKSQIVDNITAKKILAETSSNIISELSERASLLTVEENTELSIDWFNGRRTPNANQWLKGALTGLNLGTDAPKIFRSIVEGTCFGAKAIVDCFVEQGIPVKGLIGLGGVAKKSPFVMQMMADVLNMPIRIHRSDQTCALGAAMFAATAAGIHSTVESAMEAMGQGFDEEYKPVKQKAGLYSDRYRKYQDLGSFMEDKTSQQNS